MLMLLILFQSFLVLMSLFTNGSDTVTLILFLCPLMSKFHTFLSLWLLFLALVLIKAILGLRRKF